MRWESHYTGIETKQIGKTGFNLYLSRTKGRKIPDHIRLSIGKQSFGLFTRILNYGKDYGTSGYKGIEFHTNYFSFGVSYKPTWNVRCSGSLVEPYTSTIRHLGFLFIAYRTSQRRIRKLEDIHNKWCEEYINDFEFIL